MHIPRFVVILDRVGAKLDFAEVARAAIRGGADIVQVREKDLGADEVSTLVQSVIRATGNRQRVAVNSFPEVAARLGTHLHLPESATFDPEETQVAADACISRSIHGPLTAEVLDYAVLGNVFETGSKPGKPALGLAAMRQIANTASCPVLAIGGIGPAHVRSLLDNGAYGVAVRSYVIGSDDPERAARAIRTEIDRWTNAPSNRAKN